MLDTLLRPAGSVRALIWFSALPGILRLLLGSKFQYGWSPWEGSLWIRGFGRRNARFDAILDKATQRDASVSFPLIITIVAGGTAVALMLSGSMLLGQLAMALTAVVGTIVLVGFLLPKGSNGRGIVPVPR